MSHCDILIGRDSAPAVLLLIVKPGKEGINAPRFGAFQILRWQCQHCPGDITRNPHLIDKPAAGAAQGQMHLQFQKIPPRQFPVDQGVSTMGDILTRQHGA